MSADEVIQALRPKLAMVPGIRTFLQNPPPIRIGGTLTKSQYQFTLQSPNTKELFESTPLLEAKLRELPILQDVTSDLQITNPQVNIEIDRDKASALGVTAGQIEDALYTAYGSRQISTIFAPSNQYQVIMELDPKYQLNPDALSMLYIRSSSGQLVPLNTVANITKGVGPLTVNHLGQITAVTLSFNLRPGVSLGEGVDAVHKVAAKTFPRRSAPAFRAQPRPLNPPCKALGCYCSWPFWSSISFWVFSTKASSTLLPSFRVCRLPGSERC